MCRTLDHPPLFLRVSVWLAALALLLAAAPAQARPGDEGPMFTPRVWDFRLPWETFQPDRPPIASPRPQQPRQMMAQSESPEKTRQSAEQQRLEEQRRLMQEEQRQRQGRAQQRRQMEPLKERSPDKKYGAQPMPEDPARSGPFGGTSVRDRETPEPQE